jgi:ArsR family transcriptional regulator
LTQGGPIMADNIMEQIKLKTDPVYNFLSSLTRFSFHKKFNQEWEEHQFTENLELNKWVEATQKELDSQTINTINFYFSRGEFFGAGLFSLYQNQAKEVTIQEFISSLKKLKPEKLICTLLKPLYNGEEKLTTDRIENWISCPSELYDLIEENFSADAQSPSSNLNKWKIFRLLTKPNTIQDELSSLLNNYYDQIYSQIEQQATEIAANQLENNAKQFKIAAGKALTNLYSLEDGLIDYQQPVTVVITYFAETFEIGYFNPNLLIVGYRFPKYIDKVVTEEEDLSTQAHVFKTLSDKNRLKLLLELNEGPKYATELAETLDISTSTINYHIKKFLNAGLIKIDKQENKIYYKLKQKRLRKLISQLETSFNL